MPTILSHGIVAIAAAKTFLHRTLALRVFFFSAFCSILPDIDFLSFSFGIPYGHFFGHRGFTHSLLFAFITAFLTVSRFYRNYEQRARLTIYFFLITASHGVLDAMTNGGRGVAFFSPFVTTRYFLPFRPLKVSPVGLDFFFSRYSLAVLYNELIWLIIPSLVGILLTELYQRKK